VKLPVIRSKEDVRRSVAQRTARGVQNEAESGPV